MERLFTRKQNGARTRQIRLEIMKIIAGSHFQAMEVRHDARRCTSIPSSGDRPQLVRKVSLFQTHPLSKGATSMQTLWPIFLTVFLAELGDKTQLATLLFAADQRVSKLGVFAASSAALVLSSLLAVLIGGQLSVYISPKMLKLAAGIGFVTIGIWVLIDARAD
jgi:putative Ca2+/H+ antiporter (TMEM165/GDT1 family)